MAEAVVGDDDYGEDPTVRGEPGVRARAGLGVLAATPQRCPWCWRERLPGRRDGGQLGAEHCALRPRSQSDPSPESLFEIRFLGPTLTY